MFTLLRLLQGSVLHPDFAECQILPHGLPLAVYERLEERVRKRILQPGGVAAREPSDERVEDLEARVKVFDGDLDKVFKWMNKADDDLYNEYSLSQTAIGAKLQKLDGQVNNWWTGLNAQMDKLRSAVNVNSQNIKVLWNSIRR